MSNIYNDYPQDVSGSNVYVEDPYTFKHWDGAGLFIGASVIIVLRYVLELLKTYFLDYAGQSIEKKTSESVFDKIMRYDLLRAPKSNGSVAALVKDFETFQQFFTSVTILLLIDIPFMFLFLYVIYAIGGPIVLVPLLIIPLVIFVGVVVQPLLKKLAVNSLDGGEAKQTVLLETLQNIETVKSISGSDKLKKRWLKATSIPFETSQINDVNQEIMIDNKCFNQDPISAKVLELNTPFIDIWIPSSLKDGQTLIPQILL